MAFTTHRPAYAVATVKDAHGAVVSVRTRPARSSVSHPACASQLTAQPGTCAVTWRCTVIARASKGFGVSNKKDAGDLLAAQCPCGSGGTYQACCHKYLSKLARVTTPEQLLRSRFTAYHLKNAEYIADSTALDAPEYPGNRRLYVQQVKETARRAEYRSLEVLGQEQGETPDAAFIDFKVSFVDKDERPPKLVHRTERSRFVRVNPSSSWMYHSSPTLDDLEDGKEKEVKSTPSFGPIPLPNLGSLRF